MAITYPTTIDTFSNPTGTDLLENATAALDHDVQHSNANDAIEALEAKVGADGSAVTTSHDYKLGAVTGSAKALTSGTSTQSVTGLTLVSPTLTLTSDATGDMYYRNSLGAFVRLPIGTSGQILQSGASSIPEWIANPAAADASTTVKGVAEEATLAETLARTAAGAQARLFVNPTNLTTVQTYDYAASSGGTDAYAITVSPAPTAYVTGQVFHFKADVANTGGATLNVNSLGAKTIVKEVSTALEDGDIAASKLCVVQYDGTNMVLINPTRESRGVYKNGVFTKSEGSSTTTTIAHGCGRTPKRVRINAMWTNSAATHTLSAYATYNGTTQSSVAQQWGSSGWIVGSFALLSNGAGGSGGGSVGTITYDATNITITWSGTGAANSWECVWEAEA